MKNSTDVKKKVRIPKWLNITVNVLLWAFVVFAVLITTLVFTAQSKSNGGIPSLFGYSPVTILSNSMKGEFEEGDLIFVKKLSAEDAAKCEVGDILSFWFDQDGDGEEDEINTHRVVSVENGVFTLTGDAAGASTDVVPASKIIGIYNGSMIANVGTFISFLQTSKGFFLVIVLPLILFFLYELYCFITIIVKMKTQKTNVIDEEEIKRRAIEEYLRQQAAGSANPPDKTAKDDENKSEEETSKQEETESTASESESENADK